MLCCPSAGVAEHSDQGLCGVLSLWGGRLGFARVAAVVGTNMQKGKMEQQRDALQMQKAWMLVDRETTRDP
jgi:hypothetical protein